MFVLLSFEKRYNGLGAGAAIKARSERFARPHGLLGDTGFERRSAIVMEENKQSKLSEEVQRLVGA